MKYTGDCIHKEVVLYQFSKCQRGFPAEAGLLDDKRIDNTHVICINNAMLKASTASVQ